MRLSITLALVGLLAAASSMAIPTNDRHYSGPSYAPHRGRESREICGVNKSACAGNGLIPVAANIPIDASHLIDILNVKNHSD